MLNRKEKEQRVIELYQQGKNIREIAQDVHMSFGNIGAIIRKVTGPEEDNNNNIPLTHYLKTRKLSHCFQMVKSRLKWPSN